MFKSEKGTFLFSVFLQNCFLFFCIPIFHFLALLISAYTHEDVGVDGIIKLLKV